MKYIDVFAGCGGLSLGLHKAGLQGIFAVEKNADAFSTLKFNLIDNSHHFEWPNEIELKNWDINELIKKHRHFLEKIKDEADIVVGGPPCQGFSLAGLRNKDDIRNTLVDSYIEFIDLIEPKFLFFENVYGFTIAFQEKNNVGKEVFSEKLIYELKKRDYSVEARMIDLSEYGIPQKRKRFILFATKSRNANMFFEYLKQNKVPFLEKRNLEISVTVKQAIGDLERKNGEVESIDTKGYMNGTYSRKKSTYQKYMRKDLKNGSIPDSHRFAKHRETTIELFKELMNLSNRSFRITPGMEGAGNLRKRGITPLKPDSICPTLTSIPDDLIHYSEPRIMTVREYARIQSFPDDFYFRGKYTTGGSMRKKDVPRYTQVANAVPPLFAEQVGYAINGFLGAKEWRVRRSQKYGRNIAF